MEAERLFLKDPQVKCKKSWHKKGKRQILALIKHKENGAISLFSVSEIISP